MFFHQVLPKCFLFPAFILHQQIFLFIYLPLCEISSKTNKNLYFACTVCLFWSSLEKFLEKFGAVNVIIVKSFKESLLLDSSSSKYHYKHISL